MPLLLPVLQCPLKMYAEAAWLLVRLALDAALVASLRCPSGSPRFDVRDLACPGLLLELRPSGEATWYICTRTPMGTRRQIRLGDRDSLSLQDARLRCCEIHASIISSDDMSYEVYPRYACQTLQRFALERYLPFVKTYKRSWRCDLSILSIHILPVLGQRPLDRITQQDIMDLHSHMFTNGYAIATANRIVILLRYIYNLALRWQIKGVHSNPAAKLPLPMVHNERQTFISESQAKKLLDAVDSSPNQDLGLIVRMLLLTGARKREVLDARWNELDLESGLWRITRTKNQKPRIIPLSTELRTSLANRQSKQSGSPWVFVNPATSAPYKSIYYSWNSARVEAGLGSLRLHDLRHSFASFLINSGHSLYEVQQLLGHHSPSMTQRYAHLDDTTLRRAVDSVAARVIKPNANSA